MVSYTNDDLMNLLICKVYIVYLFVAIQNEDKMVLILKHMMMMMMMVMEVKVVLVLMSIAFVVGMLIVFDQLVLLPLRQENLEI